MPATTLDILEPLFVAAIVGITPRTLASRPWKHYIGHDQPVRAEARWFRVDWDGEGHTPGGFMGPLQVDTTCTLHVVVDYGGIPEHVVKRVAEDDIDQIRDVINRLKFTSPGFRWFERIDWDFASNDRNQSRIVLQYETRYMKARA